MEEKFENISSIKTNFKSTWRSKVFLTFDIDWAHDKVIHDCFELVQAYDVKSTWFVTNDCNFIKENYSKVEFGIHPNFNSLLELNSNKNASYTIESLMNLVPNSTSVRSHSLLTSERLIDLFKSFGLTHVSNTYLPYEARPFNLWDDVTIVPHEFQDNVEIRLNKKFTNLSRFLDGFHVLNFHPIHVFLNTENLARYEKTREIHHKPDELKRYRYKGYGTRNKLLDLLELLTK